VLERPRAARKLVCQVGGWHKAEWIWAVGSAEGPPVWLQLLVVEAVQAGMQVVREGADSAGPDSLGFANSEPAWAVQPERRSVGSAGNGLLQPAGLQDLCFGPHQGFLPPVEPVLPGERGAAEQVEPPVMAPGLAAEPVPAGLARIAMSSRLRLPAVPGGIPITRTRDRLAAPGPVEPAKIGTFSQSVVPA
jgi:hypothetical protein